MKKLLPALLCCLFVTQAYADGPGPDFYNYLVIGLRGWRIAPIDPKNNQALVWDSTSGSYIPTTVGGGGGIGTVSSVGLVAPMPEFTVSGSPVTSVGNLTFSKAPELANTVWAGPTSGPPASAPPTFRSLVAADLPSSGVTAGTYGPCVSATVNAQGDITSMSTTTCTGGTTITLSPGLSSNPTVYNAGTQSVTNGSTISVQQFYELHSTSCIVNSTCGSASDSGKVLTATADSVTFTVPNPGVIGTASYFFGYQPSHSYTLTTVSGTANIYGCGATATSITVAFPVQLLTDGTNYMCIANGTGTSTATGANPTATAGPTAVNGTATTFLRSDGAPAVQKGTNAQFGIVEVDGTSITSAAGVISAAAGATGANPTATAGPTAVNGTATTFLRSDGAPAVQKGLSSQFGIVEVDNTTITSAAGVISTASTTISGQTCTPGGSCTIPATGLSSIAANTYLGNPTGSSAAPAATTISTCSANNDALQYTSGTGITCATNIADLNVSQSFTKAQAVTPVALTDSSTITPDCTAANDFTLLTTSGVGASRTIANCSPAAKAGQSINFFITQASSGGPYTVTWGSNFKWPGGTAPGLSTGANQSDLISCRTSTTTIYVCNLVDANYQ